MIKNAKEWATARGLSRKNPVHQEEEFKVPTDAEFSYKNTRLREAEGSGEMTIDDPNFSLLDFSDMGEEQAIMYLA